jgi:4-amino-4-deoxy-L-arabinose transferase-like glycosyltransferase
MSPSDRGTLRLLDLALLLAFCAVVFSFPLFYNRTLTTHETVHCQNVREMAADGDWTIPHYGGRPWLERPPLPFWLTMPVVALAGDVPAAYRLASALVAVPCVLLVGWMASVWYGRSVGLLAGLILATMRQFNHYATGPEADIFLCTIVTAALALFVHLEFRLGATVGRRPWGLAGFFVLLGLANLVKGPLFGDVFILLPVAAFLLLGAERWALVRRYVWLPGWLLWLVIGSAWEVAAYLRHPDIVDLWFSDYAGRLNQGYNPEPTWYYLLQLPWMLFPWVVAAVAGLVLTWPRVRGQGRTPERFLWCWALLPVILMSLPQSKHHHYLLHAMTPWAVLAAVGAVGLWQWLRTLSWLGTCGWVLLAVVLPGQVVLAGLAPQVDAPGWFVPAVLTAWPVLILALWFTLTRRDGRWAVAGTFALLALFFWALHTHQRVMNDRYAGDRAFVRAVQGAVPRGDRLLVLDDWGPLDASWMLFHLQGRGQLLHNVTFLSGARDGCRPVYLVTRRYHETDLARYARSEKLLESSFSRGEATPLYRYALYRLRFTDDQPAHPAPPPYISPMQATGRAPGPVLTAPRDRAVNLSIPPPSGVRGQ